jgi:endonuclease YncB( thermonuclease family)
MTKKAMGAHNYSRLRKAIEGEFRRGADRIRRVYREEIILRTWNVGKILRKGLGLGDRPSTENARLVARLCRDLGRPDSFFYDAAKFHRLYPGKPPLALSMAHYSVLLRIDDAKERRLLEHQAVKGALGVAELRELLRGLLDSRGEGVPSASGGPRAVLDVKRGTLYHYRVEDVEADGWVSLDIGFGVDHRVRCKSRKSLHPGRIIRTVRESAGTEYIVKIAAADPGRLYTYGARLLRVLDGDTLFARAELGFGTRVKQTFRLRGIDAPELSAAAGKRAKEFVESRLRSCARLVIRSYQLEKYRRYLADVFYLPGADDWETILREGVFLNQELLDEGHAGLYLPDAVRGRRPGGEVKQD